MSNSHAAIYNATPAITSWEMTFIRSPLSFTTPTDTQNPTRNDVVTGRLARYFGGNPSKSMSPEAEKALCERQQATLSSLLKGSALNAADIEGVQVLSAKKGEPIVFTLWDKTGSFTRDQVFRMDKHGSVAKVSNPEQYFDGGHRVEEIAGVAKRTAVGAFSALANAGNQILGMFSLIPGAYGQIVDFTKPALRAVEEPGEMETVVEIQGAPNHGSKAVDPIHVVAQGRALKMAEDLMRVKYSKAGIMRQLVPGTKEYNDNVEFLSKNAENLLPVHLSTAETGTLVAYLGRTDPHFATLIRGLSTHKAGVSNAIAGPFGRLKIELLDTAEGRTYHFQNSPELNFVLATQKALFVHPDQTPQESLKALSDMVGPAVVRRVVDEIKIDGVTHDNAHHSALVCIRAANKLAQDMIIGYATNTAATNLIMREFGQIAEKNPMIFTPEEQEDPEKHFGSTFAPIANKAMEFLAHRNGKAAKEPDSKFNIQIVLSNDAPNKPHTPLDLSIRTRELPDGKEGHVFTPAVHFAMGVTRITRNDNLSAEEKADRLREFMGADIFKQVCTTAPEQNVGRGR